MRRTLTTIAVGFALTAATIAALHGTGILPRGAGTSADLGAKTPPAADVDDGPVGLVGPGEPCINAVMLPSNVTMIRAAVPLPVWAAPPEVAKVTRAWACGGTTPVLMYGDIQLSFEAGWSGVDIPEKWAALAADYGGRTDVIQGYQAYVKEPTADGENQEIMIVHGDTLVRLLATGAVPPADLIDLANELELPEPPG